MQAPTKYETVINLKTAKVLGLNLLHPARGPTATRKRRVVL